MSLFQVTSGEALSTVQSINGCDLSVGSVGLPDEEFLLGYKQVRYPLPCRLHTVLLDYVAHVSLPTLIDTTLTFCCYHSCTVGGRHRAQRQHGPSIRMQSRRSVTL